jgi:hypothetical protein
MIKFVLPLLKCLKIYHIPFYSVESVRKVYKCSANVVKIENQQFEMKQFKSLLKYGISPTQICTSQSTNLINSATGQSAATEMFSWIPAALISTSYILPSEISTMLCRVLFTIIAPLSLTDDMLRTRRLLLFISQLEEDKPQKAFQALPSRQVHYQAFFTSYLEAAESFNGGVVDKDKDKDELERKLDGFCANITKYLTAPENAAQFKADLKKWAERNDRRGFRLLRDLIDPEKDSKALRKSQVCKFLFL